MKGAEMLVDRARVDDGLHGLSFLPTQSVGRWPKGPEGS